jgi:starch synthase
MKILMATAEYAPLAKTGGLADAVTGLAHALFDRGHDVRVLLPRYAAMADTVDIAARAAPAGHGAARAGRAADFLELGNVTPGPRIYLAATPELGTPPDTGGAHAPDGGGSAGASTIYTGDDRDAATFMRLSQAALDLGPAVGWRPDLLHCHDWHTALVPALCTIARRASERNGASPRRTTRRNTPPSVLTLHNLGYQGIFGEQVLAENNGADGAALHALGGLAAPGALGALGALRSETTRADHTVNFLELGITFADSITTVSPTYAREIQRPEFGMGLDEALRARGAAVTGILNGVDYRLWSPETDPYLEAHYGRAAPAPKRLVKRALEAETGLPASDSAIIGCVTRLVWQKGIDVLAAALPELLEATNARFALLGSGEPELERALGDLAARHPERIAFKCGYDDALAHRILAGSDFVVVPSRYEPCGLTQLYALRYGTIPIVRATGGLADSVRHFDARAGTGNGSVFEDADTGGIRWGVTTALGWYADAETWRTLVDNAMSCDFSWARQAPEYEALYERVVAASGGRR